VSGELSRRVEKLVGFGKGPGAKKKPSNLRKQTGGHADGASPALPLLQLSPVVPVASGDRGFESCPRTPEAPAVAAV
jgi:hypothetical protein